MEALYLLFVVAGVTMLLVIGFMLVMFDDPEPPVYSPNGWQHHDDPERTIVD